MTEEQRIILVGTDGSAPAAAATHFALELAAACGDRVLFVTAWRELRGSCALRGGTRAKSPVSAA